MFTYFYATVITLVMAGQGTGAPWSISSLSLINTTASRDYMTDPLIVETSTGLVKGFSKIVLGRDLHIFYGIPFAKPPVGSLRFRRPIPIDPWHGVFEAKTLPNSCYQEKYEYFPGFDGEEMWNPSTKVSEDCLYLNIWVPQKIRLRHHASQEDNLPKKVPMLVWIYGGGYMSGASTLAVYDGDLIAASNDVIVATIQYRVGAFGFLYLGPYFEPGSDEVAGNMGLWDQALAIRWLKDNAQVFGGDPELITLFGESAGGGSASIHLISPVTRGLVKRGILQSGTINAPWSYMLPHRALDVARLLIEDCGCNVTLLDESPEKVVECMRETDAHTISVQQWNPYWGILGFPSVPTIDGVFITDHPLEMLRREKFPDAEIIIGTNLDEGTYFTLYDFIDFFEKDGPNYLPREKFLEIVETIFSNVSKIVRDAIVLEDNNPRYRGYGNASFYDRNVFKIPQYTDWDQVQDGLYNQKNLASMVGDYFFVCPSNHYAQLFADRGMKVYYYLFTQRTSSNVWGEFMGVMHGDEIEYVFGHPLNMSIQYTNKERNLSKRIMEMYTRFALTGHPLQEIEKWPSYTRDKPRYYELNADNTDIGKGPRSKECAFWNDFLPKLRLSQLEDDEECVVSEEIVTDESKALKITAFLAIECYVLVILSIFT